MKRQMKSHSIILMTLSVATLLHPATASSIFINRQPKENSQKENQYPLNENAPESPRNSNTELKIIFPRFINVSFEDSDPSSLPHRVNNFDQLYPKPTLTASEFPPKKQYRRFPFLSDSYTSVKLPQNIETLKKSIDFRQPQATMSHVISTETGSSLSDPALSRSLMNPNMNNGLFQRFKGSLSNMLPMFIPGNSNPHPLGLSSMNSPSFLPFRSIINSVIPNHHQPFKHSPGSGYGFYPGVVTGTSNMYSPGFSPHPLPNISPMRKMFSKLFVGGPRYPSYGPPTFGDLTTSGSAFIPRYVIPPYRFALPTPPIQRHKPLFNDFDNLQAASMEISNAFADFTDSKEHGPEVTQKFGSVGHTVNSFLKMMGLGSDLSFGNVGGFGGGADMAALDSTPIARSMDFYPGYGNQAHLDDFQNLDDIGDFPMFEEDITQEFMKKMNITNETTSIMEDAIKEKDMLKKVHANKSKVIETVTKSETMGNEKIPVIEEMKYEDHDNKSKKNDKEDAPAMPSLNMKEAKLPAKTKHPIVNYQIPPILSTVAPHDRKQPVAIYQNYNTKDNNGPKSPVYVPAQAMSHQEEEENPNKLVDDDVVREWRLVNSGKGYVEKHPVPILDILKNPKQPESLKVVQKVIADTVKKDFA